MDELAAAPGATRSSSGSRTSTDPRARACSRRPPSAAAGASAPRRRGRGLGLAFARYKNRPPTRAVVVEVSVDDATAAIRLARAVIAADAGQVVDPDGPGQPARGRPRAVGELDAARAGALRPQAGHQQRLGRATRSCGSPRCPRSRPCCSTGPASRSSAPARPPGPDRGGDRQRRVRRDRRARARPAAHARANPGCRRYRGTVSERLGDRARRDAVDRDRRRDEAADVVAARGRGRCELELAALARRQLQRRRLRAGRAQPGGGSSRAARSRPLEVVAEHSSYSIVRPPGRRDVGSRRAQKRSM